MVKSELVNMLAYQFKLKQDVAELVVETFFGTIADALVRKDRVELRGFGSFATHKHKGYEGFNPKTGQAVQVPDRWNPFWKAGQDLKQRVDGNFS